MQSVSVYLNYDKSSYLLLQTLFDFLQPLVANLVAYIEITEP